jgi:S-formylglutathione hydrolase FrmB
VSGAPIPRSQIRRRRLLAALAGLAIAALAAWLILGALIATDTHGASREQISVDSEAVGESLPTDVVVPEGVDPDGAPLLVFLHGRSGDSGSYSGNETMYTALEDLGERAPVIAFPDGGGDSYWHDRDGGDWGTYVTDEVIPAVEDRFGTDHERVAIGGISMGGFGAFDLARQHPARFCAVGGHSPALWTEGGATAPGAFDDAEDFEAHDVVAAAAEPGGPFSRLPVWIDEGEEDPFRTADEAFVANLESSDAELTGRIWPGAHEGDYWDEHWDEYLRFYARALERC